MVLLRTRISPTQVGNRCRHHTFPFRRLPLQIASSARSSTLEVSTHPASLWLVGVSYMRSNT